MKKPSKPKKPSKRDSAPNKKIYTRKIVLVNTTNDDVVLVDSRSHTELFTGREIGRNYGINLDKHPEYSSRLESRNNFFFFKKIYDILNVDFDIEQVFSDHSYNCEEYLYTTVGYLIDNPNYEKELERHNNRFAQYEIDIDKYNKDMDLYKLQTNEQKSIISNSLKEISKIIDSNKKYES